MTTSKPLCGGMLLRLLGGLFVAKVMAFASFAPAPIQWKRIPGRSMVLMPRVPPKIAIPSQTAGPQQALMISDFVGVPSPDEIPHFTARPDKTITWETTGLCIEATGGKSGDAVQMNHCTSGATQQWDFLPTGDAHQTRIQLLGTKVCIDVANGDFNGAPIQLRDCDKATDAWTLEPPFPKQNPSSLSDDSDSMRHMVMTLVSLSALGALSTSAWSWRKQKQANAVAMSRGEVSLGDAGGVCMLMPSAVHQFNPLSVPSGNASVGGLSSTTMELSPMPVLDGMCSQARTSVVMQAPTSGGKGGPPPTMQPTMGGNGTVRDDKDDNDAFWEELEAALGGKWMPPTMGGNGGPPPTTQPTMGGNGTVRDDKDKEFWAELDGGLGKYGLTQVARYDGASGRGQAGAWPGASGATKWPDSTNKYSSGANGATKWPDSTNKYSSGANKYSSTSFGAMSSGAISAAKKGSLPPFQKLRIMKHIEDKGGVCTLSDLNQVAAIKLRALQASGFVCSDPNATGGYNIAPPGKPKPDPPLTTSQKMVSQGDFDTKDHQVFLEELTKDEKVEVSIPEKSERLLRDALDMSSDIVDFIPPESEYDQDGAEREGKFQRAPRGPTVPPKTFGKENLRATRKALPAFDFRAQILETIRESQVCIIEGETGCGKTTQVGQFIIEDAAEELRPCYVVCTQPRRISAIGVAGRVADERGERLGDNIGYSVQLDRKYGRDTHLLFCTTGILLRRLEYDADLLGMTHVVVDEVHERTVEGDFLLLALRNLVSRRNDLKVVLMSATMDKDLFGNYFDGAPSIVIPGRTFPVKDFFLEDALQITRHVLDPNAAWAIDGGKGKGKGKGTPASRDPDHQDARKLEQFSGVQHRYQRYGPQVDSALRGMDQDALNYDLLVSLLSRGTLNVLANSTSSNDTESIRERPNGVLVFLSGAPEIENARLALLDTQEFSKEPSRSWVLPLHGGLPPDEQKKVFEHPPDGVRKIVLATNVAETSITIDDIGFVVDTCRMKEVRYDAVKRMSCLEDTVVSRTNARQRRGRAGRVAPGVAVHLGLTRFRHDNLIDDHQAPEVQRVPLEKLLLRIHATGLHIRNGSGKAANICAQLLEPPDPRYVAKSMEELVCLGAMEVDEDTGKETLTSLGKHLANLAVDVRLGKLILYGAAFGPHATDAALTIAAAQTSRSPFLAPLEVRDTARECKKSFAETMVSGPIGVSDHMAVLAAYLEWDQISRRGYARTNFCRENFLAGKTMEAMSDMKRSLLQSLSEAGFVRQGITAAHTEYFGRTSDRGDGVLHALHGYDDYYEDCCHPVLLSALLCAALFPQVATAYMPHVSQPKTEKAARNAAKNPAKPKILVKDAATGEPVKVKLHPSSVSCAETTLSSPYLLYQELANTSELYLREVTPVSPLAMALFGGPLTTDSTGHLIIDGWITLYLAPGLSELVLQARHRLDVLFDSWVLERDHDSTKAVHNLMNERSGSEFLEAIVEVLTSQNVTPLTAAPLSPAQIEAKLLERARDAKKKHLQPQKGSTKNVKKVKKGGGKKKSR